MKTIDIIEDEYELYNTKASYIKTLEDFRVYVVMGIDDNDVNAAVLRGEKRNNKKLYLLEKIKSFLSFDPDNQTDFYEEDNAIIDDALDFTRLQGSYFRKIMRLAREDNYIELLKLTEFSIEYYNDHLDYYETRRDALEYAYQGISYNNSRYSNNISVFDEFFNKKINELSTTKTVEKLLKV